MDVTRLHSWTVTPKEAVAIQRQLAPQIVVDRPLALDEVQYVAGVDVSVKNKVSQAAVVVMTWPDMTIVETVLAARRTAFPYVPGLLTFREGPVLEEALERVGHAPDLVIVDGSGIAHPRRIGIAAHLGLMIGRPTVGCAKTRLCGKHGDVAPERGSSAELIDRDEVIGMVLRTRQGVNPVFISPGHLCDLPGAVAAILQATPRYRLPEPIRAAHVAAGRQADAE